MITFISTDPVDRDVQVTVTLTFKESELRAKAESHRLALWLGDQFSDAIQGSDTEDPYPALSAL